MYTEITKDIRYIGVADHSLDLFESQYILPDGMLYNSYLLTDDKVVIMDTVDELFLDKWEENLLEALNGRKPDYLVCQHMEGDHTGGILRTLELFPECRIVCSAQALRMLNNFTGKDLTAHVQPVKEGDTLETGHHTLQFIAAPMIHWPEVIMTYVPDEHLLFSADAFGKFGAETTEDDWTCEGRRYYANIVGKYGPQVQNVLKKLNSLDIRVICPLHGPVLRENLSHYLSLYDKWSRYEPEEHGALIVYTSLHGNTQRVARRLAEILEGAGLPMECMDLTRDDMAEAVEGAFRYDTIVIATPTYDAGLMPPIETFLRLIAAKGIKERRVAIIENGSWAPLAAKIIKERLQGMKDMQIMEPVITILSAPTAKTYESLQVLADNIIG